MDNKKRNEIIMQCVCNLLQMMNISIENAFVEDLEDEEIDGNKVESVLVSVEVDKPGNLIGVKGRNLAAIQTILPLIVKNKIEKWIRIMLDVNNYREEQKERLNGMVRTLAQKAIDTGKEVHMVPMSSYERRLCHMQLSEMEGVISESEGEGEDRHIIIKLK